MPSPNAHKDKRRISLAVNTDKGFNAVSLHFSSESQRRRFDELCTEGGYVCAPVGGVPPRLAPHEAKQLRPCAAPGRSRRYEVHTDEALVEDNGTVEYDFELDGGRRRILGHGATATVRGCV